MSDILARQRTIVGTTADWAANDQILGDGEIALERKSASVVRAKIGDGILPFSESPYLGGEGGSGGGDGHTLTEIVAAAGQTDFDPGAEYAPGQLGVYVNGVRLSEEEFAATDGSTVTLDEPCLAGDLVLLDIFGGAGGEPGGGSNAGGISAADFGLLGDGSDETAGLTDFFNSAISNPGVPHILEANKTYGFSAPLPVLNVSGVIIRGGGCEFHDAGGSSLTGTILKWLGGPYSAGHVLSITSVSGPSNKRVHSIQFTGIGLDHNNGALKYGMEVLSVRNCDIDLVSMEAGEAGWCLYLGMCTVLGESADVQRCRIRHRARNTVAHAFSLVLAGSLTATGGSVAANVSLNEFWCDYQFKNQAAMYLLNSDGNTWHFVRCGFVGGGGTATESIALLGGATASETSRSEKFGFVSVNKPIHVYGTETYASPSMGHIVHDPDLENGFPAPVVGTGAFIEVGGLWQNFTPVYTADAGTLGAVTTIRARWHRFNNIVQVNVVFSVDTVGDASGAIKVSLPAPAPDSFSAAGASLSAGIALMVIGGSGVLRCAKYDSTSPIVAGQYYIVTATYETAQIYQGLGRLRTVDESEHPPFPVLTFGD